MTPKYLIGVDIGTQGTKAALFTDSGICLANHFKPSKLMRPRPGVVEEDPEDQVAGVCDTVHACVTTAGMAPNSVAAVALCGQMAGIIGVDRNGRHVTPYDSWLDTRCAPYIDRMTQLAGDQILIKSGCSPSVNHGPKILWWRSEQPEQYRRIHAFVQPSGYAAMRLCGLDGNAAFIDPSYLHFSGFADNRNQRWDTELCQRFEVDMEKMPLIVDAASIIGEITDSMASKCGLSAGTPVAAGCGDSVASFLACGATQPGVCVDVAGTASVFAATTTDFRPDLAHGTLGCGQAPQPGLWHPYAYINGGGLNLEWFRKEIANHGRADDQGSLSFEALDALVDASTPELSDPLFIPHMGGRVCPSQPHLRGALLGITWPHTLGKLYRAVLEGVALEYGCYLDMLADLYPELDRMEIRVTGGGETNQVWNQIKADLLGIPVVQVKASQGAPLGLALLAGKAVGLFDCLDEVAAHWIQLGHRTLPDPEKYQLYRQRLSRYRAFCQAIEPLHAN